MIFGPLVTLCPFPVPGLFWRETIFTVDAAGTAATGEDPLGPMRVMLPADLAGAVPKRKAEFLAGRLCAALALRAAGQPVEVDRDGRAPVWPRGVAGSISHCAGHAIAAVSLRHGAVGLDCEEVMSDSRAEDLGRALVSPGEEALRPASLPRAAFVTLAFSAKEALYKALSPRLSRIPGFLEAQVVEIGSSQVLIAFEGHNWPVRWRIDTGLCRTLATDPA